MRRFIQFLNNKSLYLSPVKSFATAAIQKKIVGRSTTASSGKLNKAQISERIEGFLKIKRIESINLVNKHKGLRKITEETLTNNFNTCTKYNIPSRSLLTYPEILAQKRLEEKIELLKKVPYPLSTTCCLLLLPDKLLENFALRYRAERFLYTGGRIKYMSELMKENEHFICNRLLKVKFLVSIDLEKLKKVYDLILSFGLTRADINKDLWALSYSYDTINQRLCLVKEMNVGKLKLWMVRAQAEIFQKYVDRIKDNRQVLGSHSLIEYLSEKLDCSDEQVKFLLTKLPALKTKRMKKIQEMLDFLYTKGFKPIHVYRMPKILLHSVTTIRKRLTEIEKENIELDSLYMLTKSQKQYKQYYEALVRSKKVKTCS